MDITMKLFLFIAIFCSTTLQIFAEDACVTKSPCVCEFSNGTGIDLSSASKSTFFTTQTYQEKKNGSQIELATYYYHPCYDILVHPNTTVVNNTCTMPLTICRYVKNFESTNDTTTFKVGRIAYDKLGTNADSSFTPKGDAIVYTNGPSSTIVLLFCSETDGQLQIYSLEDPEKLVLAFYSRAACLKQIDSGRSLGSTLVIIFFSLAVFYIVLGVCTKKFLMGATGIEVIPNLAFWSGLPGLVKDGWAFLISGFKLPARGAGATISPDPNSYDSI